jgi:asparagine synthase (glutamine-hydrolysing)
MEMRLESKPVRLRLVRNEGFRWATNGTVHVKGYFHIGSKLFGGDSAVEFFTAINGQKEFESSLRELNGSFAVVICREDKILAAVDRLRSIPLFYSDSGQMVLSDSASEVLVGLPLSELDEFSREDFLSAGYTVGNSTLFRGMKQLQAGQFFCFEAGLQHVSYYYRHDHFDFWTKSDSEHKDDLGEIVDAVFERLIESCSGRTIVLPLSGGYDSRFIAAALKMRGVEDVICFTYGRPESFEVEMSRKVAHALDYEWKYVEYSKQKWRQCFHDIAFVDYASNYSSLPNVQDYVAIRELRENGSLPDDSVFVPGYCGDLLGGSYVPYDFRINRQGRLKIEGLTTYVLRNHFGADVVEPAYANRLTAEFSDSSSGDWAEDFVSNNEEFFTRHKVAKYVVNALRSVEYFGYEWRMPLWDNELTEYFYRVPLSQRLENGLYERFLMDRVFKQFGIDHKKPEENVIKRKYKEYCPEKLFGISDAIYQFGVRMVKNKAAADFNAMTYFIQMCADEMDSEGSGIGDGIISVHSRWYVDSYISRRMSK